VRQRRAIAIALIAVTIGASTGCGQTGRQRSPADEETLTVAVQNLYVGAELRRLLVAQSLEEIPATAASVYGNIRNSRYPERAGAIAEGIAAHRPHLIGLQEVSLLRRQSPGDTPIGNPRAAREVTLDFLAILLEELKGHGMNYREVARYRGMDVELPVRLPVGGLDDMRLTDHGVILARADVPIRYPRSANFQTNLTVRVGGEAGLPVELLGGWASVEATVNGRSIRFVTTHLESADLAPEVQHAQVAELLAALADDSLPVVLVGDFSSTPDGAMTSTYHEVRAAGFVDLWAERANDARTTPAREGATCCQRADLRNPESELTRRLDFIFYRKERTDRGAAPVGGVHVWRLGATPEERTLSGRWPSDHAGIVATIGLAPHFLPRPTALHR